MINPTYKYSLLKRRHTLSNQFFPTGKFTYTVGEYSPVVDIYEKGKMTLSLDGEVIVIAKYQVTGEILEVADLKGSYASPEYGAGKYQWNFAGKTMTFKLIEDKNPARLKSFAIPWYSVA
jgi:hypothetical protein